MESVHLTSTIDVKEERDVATLDLPNTFMQTNIGDECVLMKLRGAVAELMVRLAHETHSNCVSHENSTPMLHVELLKALHGILKSALNFCIKVVEYFKEERFELNPHDGCVSNKLVDGNYQTACWHADDLKVGHVDPKVNDILIKNLRKIWNNWERKYERNQRKKNCLPRDAIRFQCHRRSENYHVRSRHGTHQRVSRKNNKRQGNTSPRLVS